MKPSFLKTRISVLTTTLILACGIYAITSYGSETASRQVSGTFGTGLADGTFSTGGNAGQVFFATGLTDTAESFSGVTLECDNCGTTTEKSYLSGYFFVQTVGWFVMGNGQGGKLEVIPPHDDSVIQYWTLSGVAWSDNAGYMSFNHSSSSDPLSGQSVIFDPRNLTFEWFAWSDTLGWVTMSQIQSLLGEGFLGRVKVIGNTGGNKIYDILQASMGARFDSSSMTTIINELRKSVAIRMRGATIESNHMNPPTKIQDTLMYRTTESASGAVAISRIATELSKDDARALFVVGRDIYIDQDIIEVPNKKPVAIIALANDLGQWWNIYIKWNVKKIYASLIAEGSLFSGRYDGANFDTPMRYNDTQQSIPQLPPWQLYIHGTLVSRNTIWGSARDGSTPDCPYTATTCNYSTSLRYDLNYFRNFDEADIHKAIDGYNLYSVIIEYDPRVLADPPPGLSDL